MREPDAQESPEPNGLSTNDFEQAFSNLSNAELLAALDLPLLELEKRLYRYTHVGPELLEMDDEGLVLAVRAKARLGRRSLPPSIPKSSAVGKSRRVEAHRHPHLVEHGLRSRGRKPGVTYAAITYVVTVHKAFSSGFIEAKLRSRQASAEIRQAESDLY